MGPARILPTIFVLAAFALPVSPKPHAVLSRVTVDQFDGMLASLRQRNDGSTARTLAALELTERPDREHTARWAAEMPGRRASAALLALTDGAAFLAPPAADVPVAVPPAVPPAVPVDVPPDAAPDAQEQARIFALAQQYVKHVTPRLPNFSALRSSTGFELASPGDIAGEQLESRWFPAKNGVVAKVRRDDLGPTAAVPLAHLYLDGVWNDTVTYRDGKEVAMTSPIAGSEGQRQLATSGEFGPILWVVMGDAAHGKIVWSRWERVPPLRLAVFTFEVPHDSAHYAVEQIRSRAVGFPAYHGEIAIDPATGSIYRITVEAWQREAGSVQKSGIEVDYATVTIGGAGYVCPVHGAAFLRVYTPFVDEDAHPEPAPWYETLNDVTFTQYHVFRAETRILPADESGR